MNIKQFLSDVVSIKNLDKNKFNLIKAPTGSGKSTFCLNELPKLSKHLSKIVYLCPTVALVEQITTQNPLTTRIFNKKIDDFYRNQIECEVVNICEEDPIMPNGRLLTDNRIIVMTYERFGLMNLKYKDFYTKKPLERDYITFSSNFDVIICDEFHDYDWRFAAEKSEHRKRLLRKKPYYSTYKTDKRIAEMLNKEINLYMYNESSKLSAFEGIAEQIGLSYVVGISATPNCNFLKDLDGQINEIKEAAKLKAMEISQTIYYNDLKKIINTLPTDIKVLFYAKQIKTLKKVEKMAQEQGFNTCSLWSINNTENKMSNFQLEVREHLMQTETILEPVNFLLLNKSYEMGVNIKTPIDTVIIHCQEETAIVQATGRCRQDVLEKLYLFSNENKQNFSFPIEFLNVPLSTKEKTKLIEWFQENQNFKGKWTTLKKFLIDNGAKIKDGRKTIDSIKYCISTITF